VTHEFKEDIVCVRVTPPHVGQFGLDVYAAPQNASNKGVVAHVCKYLLNCTFVASPVDIPSSNGSPTSPVNPGDQSGGGGGSPRSPSISGPSSTTASAAIVPGPRSTFAELGLKTITHHDPFVQKFGKGASSLVIEIGHPETVRLGGRLTRAPGVQEELKVVEKTKGRKTKFTIALPGEGTYSFGVFAAQKNDVHSTNVYNYVIEHRDEDPKKKRK